MYERRVHSPKSIMCHSPEFPIERKLEALSATSSNPSDRGKPGTKRHLVTDARGTPLSLRLTAANRHDSPQMAPTLDAIPPLNTGRRGRPRRRSDQLHADEAYDAKARPKECRARGSCRASPARASKLARSSGATAES